MKGNRALTAPEAKAVAGNFVGPAAPRNRGLFVLGLCAGGRISELLALKIGDVWKDDKPATDLTFRKENTKGKQAGRSVPLNRAAQRAIRELLAWHRETFSFVDPARALFATQHGGPITRQTAHRIIRAAVEAAGVTGRIATHTMRKTYAQIIYRETDIYCTKEMLGHARLSTTRDYLSIDYNRIRTASEFII